MVILCSSERKKFAHFNMELKFPCKILRKQFSGSYPVLRIPHVLESANCFCKILHGNFNSILKCANFCLSEEHKITIIYLNLGGQNLQKIIKSNFMKPSRLHDLRHPPFENWSPNFFAYFWSTYQCKITGKILQSQVVSTLRYETSKFDFFAKITVFNFLVSIYHNF